MADVSSPHDPQCKPVTAWPPVDGTADGRGAVGSPTAATVGTCDCSGAGCAEES